MQARMSNPVILVPDALKGLHALSESGSRLGVPPVTIELIKLRVSQINGCSVCVDMHWRDLRKAGESDERMFAVAAWRDAPYFTEAERAALALAEAATRLADRPDPVPDDVWAAAAKHYDEEGLAGLLIAIVAINAWNRFNVSTRQVPGDWGKES